MRRSSGLFGRLCHCCVWALVVIPGLAFAQTPSQYTVTVTDAQLNIIGKALGKLPYEEVGPLITIVAKQIAEQQAKAEADAKKAIQDKIDKAVAEHSAPPPPSEKSP